MPRKHAKIPSPNSMPEEGWRERLFEVEVAQGFFDRLVLGFLQGFLELAGKHIFLFLLGFPGLAELFLAPQRLPLEHPRSVADIHIGCRLGRGLVREDDAELRVNLKLGLAARASNFDRRRALLHHARILRQFPALRGFGTVSPTSSTPKGRLGPIE